MNKMSKTVFEREFLTYDPRNHGQQVGSNNGNYLCKTIFQITEDGKVYMMESDSSNGDLTPYPDWEELSMEEFFKQYEAAAIEEYLDSVVYADK